MKRLEEIAWYTIFIIATLGAIIFFIIGVLPKYDGDCFKNYSINACNSNGMILLNYDWKSYNCYNNSYDKPIWMRYDFGNCYRNNPDKVRCFYFDKQTSNLCKLK